MARLRRMLRRAVGISIVLLGVATLLGFLDSVFWPFELAAIFRLQYAAALVLLAVPALALGLRRVALLAAVFVAVNVVTVVPAPEPGAVAAAPAPGAPIRLLLVNVEAGNKSYEELVRFVREEQPDAIGVTELDPSWARELASRLPEYGNRLTEPEDGAYGIGLFSKLPVDARVAHFPEHDGPPSIVASLRAPDSQPFTLVVTHVHTPFAGSIHERQLESLAAARPGFGERVAVCGDFNTPPWTAAFKRLADSDLADLYGGSWPGYSWPTWNPLLRLPIDNCLVAGLGVTDHRHGPDIGSDHFPLVVDLTVPRTA